MKIRKEVLYVLSLILIIVLIIFIFGESINFSPGAKSREDSEYEIIRNNWIEHQDEFGKGLAGQGQEAGEMFVNKLYASLEREGLI